MLFLFFIFDFSCQLSLNKLFLLLPLPLQCGNTWVKSAEDSSDVETIFDVDMSGVATSILVETLIDVIDVSAAKA